MTNSNFMRSINVLLIEDSPADVRLTKETLKEEKMRLTLHVVSDGVEALHFLRKEGKFQEAVRPDLVLLDLNLPKKDGREVLKEIKSDDDLKTIPIVVLTVSKAEEDVFRAYNLHANCYITKPIDLDQFSIVVRSIKEFWLTIVKLPLSEGQ